MIKFFLYMKTTFYTFLITCIFLCTIQISNSQNLYITGGYYFDVVSGEMIKNNGIVIQGGVFTSINTPLEDLDGYNVIQLGVTEYILPGIFDLHAHYRVTFDGVRRDEVEANPIIFLANGVTSTFPGGEIQPEVMLKARKLIDSGKKLSSGPYFGTAFPDWDPNTTVSQINTRVDKWAKLGVSGFKAKGITPIQLEALIKRAHLHDLTVTGHLGSGYNNTVNPRDAINMGIDRIEHFLGGDAIPNSQSAYATLQDLDLNNPKVLQQIDKEIDLFIEKGVYFDATLTAYGYYGHRNEFYNYWHDERKYLTPYAFESTKETRQKIDMFQKIFDIKKVTAKRYYDRGGLISLGTDHPSVGEYIPGFSAHREMEALASIGIPNKDVLKIATINGAKAMRLDNHLGSIEVNKLADLFIITGNPLDDITNTRNVQTVVKEGRAFSAAILLKNAEGKMGSKAKGEWN